MGTITSGIQKLESWVKAIAVILLLLFIISYSINRMQAGNAYSYSNPYQYPQYPSYPSYPSYSQYQSYPSQYASQYPSQYASQYASQYRPSAPPMPSPAPSS